MPAVNRTRFNPRLIKTGTPAGGFGCSQFPSGLGLTVRSALWFIGASLRNVLFYHRLLCAAVVSPGLGVYPLLPLFAIPSSDSGSGAAESRPRSAERSEGSLDAVVTEQHNPSGEKGKPTTTKTRNSGKL